jgi:hypothetical protein
MQVNTVAKVAALTAICVLTSAVSVAQSIDQVDLEKCAAEATAQRKLACYDALTLSGRRPPPAPAIEVGDVVAAVPAPDHPSEAVASPARAVVIPSAVETTVSQVENHEDPAAAATQAKSAVAPAAADANTEAPPDSKSVLTVSVVEVTSGRFDVLYFHFDNGQIWRQIQARRFRYPKNRAFDVTISTGAMGDHQLRVDGDGPMTRIRRVK